MQDLMTVLETLFFAADQPLSLKQLTGILDDFPNFTPALLDCEISKIQAKYQNSGIELKQFASGYLFQTRIEYAPWVQKLWQEKPRKYSQALLEILAIIACEQPITRAEIELRRGVGLAPNVLKTLLEREWIKVVGHKESPGRPALYASTPNFLAYFNLSSIEELRQMLTEDVHEL
jgi:segregation and condensation protein B